MAWYLSSGLREILGNQIGGSEYSEYDEKR